MKNRKLTEKVIGDEIMKHYKKSEISKALKELKEMSTKHNKMSNVI